MPRVLILRKRKYAFSRRKLPNEQAAQSATAFPQHAEHNVEFYHVAGAIVLRYKGKLLPLQSAFDDKLDDFPIATRYMNDPNRWGPRRQKVLGNFLRTQD